MMLLLIFAKLLLFCEFFLYPNLKIFRCGKRYIPHSDFGGKNMVANRKGTFIYKGLNKSPPDLIQIAGNEAAKN
jgi:hypothetical protein